MICHMAVVLYHQAFATQLEVLHQSDRSVFADVVALVTALADFGREIEGNDHGADPSHPIITSKYDVWALRRTPATQFTPEANGAPVLRIPYVWMENGRGGVYALVLFIGDKTELGNKWYPAAVARIEGEFLPKWEGAHPGHRARRRKR
jgi:hypothetical protein